VRRAGYWKTTLKKMVQECSLLKYTFVRSVRLILIRACDICTFVHVHFLSGDFSAAALMYMDFGKFHFLYSPVTSLFCF